jgi:mono/diheme cytochrome c family protein
VRRRHLVLAGGVAAAIAAVAADIVGISTPGGPDDATVALRPDDAETVALGERVYATECAACHGAELEGKPDWRERRADGRLPAPPHDAGGHTWHHPDGQLFDLTKRGIAAVIGEDYDTDMPAYDGIRSDAEIIAALSYIKSRWPEDIRARHDRINEQVRAAR